MTHAELRIATITGKMARLEEERKTAVGRRRNTVAAMLSRLWEDLLDAQAEKSAVGDR